LDRHLSGITFVSEDLRKRFETRLGRPPRCPVSVIPMGISLTGGSPDHTEHLLRLAAGRRIVATVGRLTPIKGLNDLAEALSGIEDVVWLCAGDGPEDERLQDLCQRNDVTRIALGAVAPPLRDALLSVADVFVLPSRPCGYRTEGTPTALLEAFASGTPCIASEIGGVGAVAREAEAILMKPGDVAQLQASILAILDGQYDRKVMSAAHRRVGQRYSWDSIGAKHAAALALSGSV